MTRNSRYNLIKPLQANLPRGAPFDIGILKTYGVSPVRAANYAAAGWLVRLGQGIYAFPNDELQLHDTLIFLQNRVKDLHIAGKSALSLHGVRHNLSSRETLTLWGSMQFAVPDWFESRFPARYTSASMFDWASDDLADKTIVSPPGVPQGLKVSVPERAVLELLYDVGVKENLEEARNIFDGLRNPRRQMLGTLLSCCTSVKTVRLFLTWARETGVIDVDSFLQEYSVSVGSDARWMKRLDDGTLLSLKPHG
jgi:hypothetical protein